MPRIAILDTLYQDFLRGLSFEANKSYDESLANVLAERFGTFDAYSYHLRALGWETMDVIANSQRLQQKWAKEHDFPRDILRAQIEDFKPDVIFCQDLSLARLHPEWHGQYYLAGQLSCPWPGDGIVSMFDRLFTSFFHYVPRFEALGVKGCYLPLAFDPRMLQYESATRDIEMSFCGGIGRNLHWKRGTDTIEAVASHFGKRFRCYGYGSESLNSWAGYAWGKQMYQVYGRSKIVINRHGEVSEGQANNLRLYEASGMGALVFTEEARQLDELFPRGTMERYEDTERLVEKIEYYLANDMERERIAKAGQRQTLNNHTYAQRMKIVSDILTREMAPVHD